MPQDLLTDTSLRRRQHTGAMLGYTGASLGLTALGLRGGAGAIRQGRQLGKFTKLTNPAKKADHLERTSNTVGTVAAGLGGIAGFNGARMSQDAYRRHKVKKSEIAKMGSPKVRTQSLMQYDHDNKTGISTSFSPTTAAATYHGKSMVLRRPKYHLELNNPASIQAAGARMMADKTGRHSTMIGITPVHLRKTDRNNLHQAVTHKNKNVSLQGQRYAMHQPSTVDKSFSADVIFKAYDPEANRRKRLTSYQVGATAASGALGATGLRQGKLARSDFKEYQTRTHKGDVARTNKASLYRAAVGSEKVSPTGRPMGGATAAAASGLKYKAAAAVDEGSHFKAANTAGLSSLKRTGRAGALGLAGAGALYGANRIGVYKKSKRGQAYVPRSY